MGLNAQIIELLTRPGAEKELELMMDSAKNMLKAKGIDGKVQAASGSSLMHLLENDRFQAGGAGYKVTDEGAQRTWFAKVKAHMASDHSATTKPHSHTAETTIT